MAETDTAALTDRTAQLLDEFDLVSEDDLAALFAVNPKTLRNTPHADLPAFVKIGRKRFFLKSAVREHLLARTVNPPSAATATGARRRPSVPAGHPSAT